MNNIIEVITVNTPSGVNEVNVYITDMVNNLLLDGKGSVVGDLVKVDLGSTGSVGDSVLIYIDNIAVGVSEPKGSVGHSKITTSSEDFLDLSGNLYSTSIIDQSSEIWSIME